MPNPILTNAIKPKLITLDLKGSTKKEIIKEFIAMFDEAGVISDTAEAERVMIERETVMSTGMEKGIAIPHGKTDTVTQLIAAIGIKKEGIDFDSIDGEPTRIFIATLSPASGAGPHIRFMAAVTSLLHNDENRSKLLNATTTAEVMDVINS